MPPIFLNYTSPDPFVVTAGDEIILLDGVRYSGRITDVGATDATHVSIAIDGRMGAGEIYLVDTNVFDLSAHSIVIGRDGEVGEIFLAGSGNSIENDGEMSGTGLITVANHGADFTFLNTGTIEGTVGALFADNSIMTNELVITAGNYSFVLDGNNSEMINNGRIFASDIGLDTHAVRLTGDHNVFRNTGTISNTDGSTSTWIEGEQAQIFNDGDIASMEWHGMNGRLENGVDGTINRLDVFADDALILNRGQIDALDMHYRDSGDAPTDLTIRNFGTISDLNGFSDNGEFRNFGTMERIDIIGDNNRFINNGLIERSGLTDTVYMDGGNIVFVNNDTIIHHGIAAGVDESSERYTVHLEGGSNGISFSNSGDIVSDQSFEDIFIAAVGLSSYNFSGNGEVIDFNNSGTISGIVGLEFTGSINIVNSGLISAETVGIRPEYPFGELPAEVTLINSGTIEAWGEDFQVIFSGYYSTDFVRNTGAFIGDLHLDAYDDAYKGANGTIDGIVYAGEGRDLVIGGINNDEFCGGQGNDILRGKKGDDLIYGGAGADEVSGGDGADTLYGQGGNDQLFGFAHSDQLYGGKGDDLLDGGRGNDMLTGGLGADDFVFSLTSNQDIVSDFSTGEDHIDLSLFGVTFVDIMAASSNTTDGLRIDLTALGGHGAVVLTGITDSDLSATDFLL